MWLELLESFNVPACVNPHLSLLAKDGAEFPFPLRGASQDG
jgi:hypothetical protein